MKRNLLLSSLILLVFSGCSSIYKSGQTPDDVYYSPGRDVPTRKEEVRQQEQQEQYEEYVSSKDDRYLRMKVSNRYRWDVLDDYSYWYDSRYDFNSYQYGYSGYNGWNSYYWNQGWNYPMGYGYYGAWNPYFGGMGWGWSNPVYTVIGYANPKFYSGTTSESNITAYKNKTYNNSNLGYKDPKTGAWINTGNNNNFGNLVKRVFSSSASGNNANNNNSSWERPARTFTPPANSSAPATTSSSAGGNSGGFKSSGSSTSSGRGGRGN